MVPHRAVMCQGIGRSVGQPNQGRDATESVASGRCAPRCMGLYAPGTGSRDRGAGMPRVGAGVRRPRVAAAVSVLAHGAWGLVRGLSVAAARALVRRPRWLPAATAPRSGTGGGDQPGPRPPTPRASLRRGARAGAGMHPAPAILHRRCPAGAAGAGFGSAARRRIRVAPRVAVAQRAEGLGGAGSGCMGICAQGTIAGGHAGPGVAIGVVAASNSGPC